MTLYAKTALKTAYSSSDSPPELSQLERSRQRSEAIAAAREERLAALAVLEDEIFERSASIVNHSLHFAQLDPREYVADPEDPPEEVERKKRVREELALAAWPDLTEKERAERLLVVEASWRPMSSAPVGLRLAQQTMIGIARARGHKVSVANQMNVQIRLPAPTSKEHPEHGEQYEVIDVE